MHNNDDHISEDDQKQRSHRRPPHDIPRICIINPKKRNDLKPNQKVAELIPQLSPVVEERREGSHISQVANLAETKQAKEQNLDSWLLHEEDDDNKQNRPHHDYKVVQQCPCAFILLVLEEQVGIRYCFCDSTGCIRFDFVHVTKVRGSSDTLPEIKGFSRRLCFSDLLPYKGQF